MHNHILRTTGPVYIQNMHYLQHYLFFCNLAYWAHNFCEIIIRVWTKSPNEYTFCFEGTVRFYAFKISYVHNLI